AEVARALGIPHAVTTLAIYGETRGSSSKSFVQGRQQLFHGNQEMAGALDYDPKRKFHQSDHTLSNIFTTLDAGFLESEGRLIAKSRIAEYLVLDALIGNTDRHHENWGVLVRSSTAGGLIRKMAPTFDHASPLGRELRDFGDGRTRQHLLDKGKIGSYSERARGGVFWSSADKHAPSPLELARRGAREFPKEFSSALDRVRRLDVVRLREATTRVPSQWMSDLAKRFAIELMYYNLQELQVLLK